MNEREQIKRQRAEVRALLKQNIKDTFKLEMWPWLQVASTLAFIFIILTWSTFLEEYVEVSWLIFVFWIIFNLYAMYKTYKDESYG